MPVATRYSTDFRAPDLIRRGATTTIRCALYRAGSLLTPSSATVSVYDEAGTAVVSGASATVADGVCTYDVLGSATTGLDLSDGWRISWSLTLPDGVVYTAENNAILCRHVPACPVSERDVWARVPSLHPDAPGRISTRRDYSGQVDEAWVQVQHLLLQGGRRHELVVTATQLREVTLCTLLALIYEDLAAGLQDGASLRVTAADYRRQAQAAFAALSLSYDSDDNSTPDGPMSARSSVWLY